MIRYGRKGGRHVPVRSKVFHDLQDRACLHRVLAAIIALLGTSQNSLLLTQETGKQLGVVMALVFGIITIVEAFMAPPEAIISDKIISGWKTAPDTHSPVVGMQKSGE
jgi:hypothetical protein